MKSFVIAVTCTTLKLVVMLRWFTIKGYILKIHKVFRICVFSEFFNSAWLLYNFVVGHKIFLLSRLLITFLRIFRSLFNLLHFLFYALFIDINSISLFHAWPKELF